MPSPPWFRFYSETLSDRKIDRICRATEHPKCTVIGAWSILMSLANDSPIRGVLLLTEEMPFTLEDLADEMGLPVNTATVLLDEFQRFNMLYQNDGTYYLTNWDKRQFSSDSSTRRVQKHREQKRQEEAPPPEDDFEDETPTEEIGNSDETLQDSYSNAPEQIRAEQIRDRSESPAVAGSDLPGGPSPPAQRGLTEGQRFWLASFGAKRFANNVQKDAVLALEQKHGTDTLRAGVSWAAKQGMNMGKAVTSLETALPKWGTPKGGKVTEENGRTVITVDS